MKIGGAVVELLWAGLKFGVVAVLLGDCLIIPRIPEASATEAVREVPRLEVIPKEETVIPETDVRAEIDGAFNALFHEVSANAEKMNYKVNLLENGGLMIHTFVCDQHVLIVLKKLYYGIMMHGFVDHTNAAVIGFYHALPISVAWGLRPKVFLTEALRKEYMGRVDCTKKAEIRAIPNSSITKYVNLYITSEAVHFMVLLLLLSSHPPNPYTAMSILDYGVDEMLGTVSEANDILNFVKNIKFSDEVMKDFPDIIDLVKSLENQVNRLNTELPATNKRRFKLRHVFPVEKDYDHTFRPSYNYLIGQWKTNFANNVSIFETKNERLDYVNRAHVPLEGLLQTSRILVLTGLLCAFEFHDKFIETQIGNAVLSAHLDIYYHDMENSDKHRKYLNTGYLEAIDLVRYP